jgi:hypothetical protein
MLLLLGFIGAAFYLNHLNERELRETEAEADRLDPGWRLHELESNRAIVRDADNSSPLLLAAAALVPGAWPAPPPPAADPKLEDRLYHFSPHARLDKELRDALRAALQQAKPAVDLARRLADYPRGRYAIPWSALTFESPVYHLEPVLRVKRSLYFDALVRAEDGDTAGAARSCLAALNAGRSLDGEPIFGSQIVRAHCQLAAEHAVERLLAQGCPSEETLKKLQAEFIEDTAQPVLLLAFRSYRALTHQDLIALKEKRVNHRRVYAASPYGIPDQAFKFNDAFRARACHAAYLRYVTQLVEIAKLPPEQQGPRLEELKLPQLAKPMVFAIAMVPDQGLRQIHCRFLGTLALLRCAVTALAIERYQRARGQWPGSLAQLIPQYLPEEQLDPFDGAALRYRRLEDGVVIYSVGPDRKDHGGQLTREMPPPEGADLGFRLWDPSKRSKVAVNPSADDQD